MLPDDLSAKKANAVSPIYLDTGLESHCAFTCILLSVLDSSQDKYAKSRWYLFRPATSSLLVKC